MSDKEKTNSACKCEDIKKIVIAMCDVGPGHSNISAGSLPCETLRALMHEEFPYFNEASAPSGTNCSCPECGSVICTCNWGFEEEEWDDEEYAAPFPTTNRMDRFPVGKGE